MAIKLKMIDCPNDKRPKIDLFIEESKMPKEILLSNIDSFGDVAAEDDSVLDYFVETDAVSEVLNENTFLVLGRKGTGKTALVRYFTESHHETQFRAINLRDYPWAIHARMIDRSAERVEAYVASWRYLLIVEAAVTMLENCKKFSAARENLTEFLNKNFSGTSPTLQELVSKPELSLEEVKIEPKAFGASIGSVSLRRGPDDLDLGLELNALCDAIEVEVRDLMKAEGVTRFVMLFDELDQGLTELSDDRKNILIGLIIAARNLRRANLSGSGALIQPLILLRTDIWDALQFSDKNKITQTNVLPLTWDANSLLALINARLKAKLGNDVSWEELDDGNVMRGSQKKFDHMITRSFLRPRDIIKFANIALAEAKARDNTSSVFINGDISGARTAYSNYVKRELDDEIKTHWPKWDVALQAISSIAMENFEKDDFVSEFSQRSNKAGDISSDEALEMLFDYSVIAYRQSKAGGGSGWIFKYADRNANWDSGATRFKVHPGLKEYAKLREKRAR